MRTKQKKPRPPISGMFHANILLPEELHQQMIEIQQLRREAIKGDIRLCMIYREAVEQYIHAKPQQRLLNGNQRSLRATG